MADLSFHQRQAQTQVQVLTQKQIQSVTLLSYSSENLREEIYKAAEANPALVIRKDNIAGSSKLSSKVSSSAQMDSDTFQATLESAADERNSLTDFLLNQLNMLRLTESEYEIGKALIYNLNQEGFHTLDPHSLIPNKDNPNSEASLNKMISLIQNFEPCGCCCTDIFESLYIQAKQNENCPKLALFLLDGHYKDFLDTAKPDRILKKIIAYKKQREALFGDKEFSEKYPDLILTEEEIVKSIKFIQSLEPRPARNFTVIQTHYVAPDVYVEKIEDKYEQDNFEKGIVVCPDATYFVHTANEEVVIPEVNPEFIQLIANKNINENEKADLEEKIRKAKEFIDSLNFRYNTILQSACHLVKIQSEFFSKGPGHLVPLKQSELAKLINVHETTISRMANSKYINCSWGLFEIKYFFTNAISKTTSLTVEEATQKQTSASTTSTTSETENSDTVSRDKVLYEIKNILEEHKNDSKKLSDQKLSDLLAERGIKVARRTVAKYRGLLNIESSYER